MYYYESMYSNDKYWRRRSSLGRNYAAHGSRQTQTFVRADYTNPEARREHVMYGVLYSIPKVRFICEIIK